VKHRALLGWVLGFVLAVASPWDMAARRARPRWYPMSWCLTMQCETGRVDADVFFNGDEQAREWGVVRWPGRGLPTWRHGSSKTAAEAKEGAERAVEEMSR